MRRRPRGGNLHMSSCAFQRTVAIMSAAARSTSIGTSASGGGMSSGSKVTPMRRAMCKSTVLIASFWRCSWVSSFSASPRLNYPPTSDEVAIGKHQDPLSFYLHHALLG